MVNLLLGLTLGLSLLAAASTWAALQWRSDRHIVQRSQTQQELRALMDTLVHDIRRAQFQGDPQNLQISPHQLLFTVNRNDNTLRDNNECSGFRLNGNLLQTQTSCQPVVWTSLNDSRSFQVLALKFQWECDAESSSQGDLLLIEVQTQASHEPVPTTWQRHVRMRNVHARMRPTTATCASAA